MRDVTSSLAFANVPRILLGCRRFVTRSLDGGNLAYMWSLRSEWPASSIPGKESGHGRTKQH